MQKFYFQYIYKKSYHENCDAINYCTIDFKWIFKNKFNGKNLLISHDVWVTKDCYLIKPDLLKIDTFRLMADTSNECDWNDFNQNIKHNSIGFYFNADTVKSEVAWDYTITEGVDPFTNLKYFHTRTSTFHTETHLWKYDDKNNVISITYNDSISTDDKTPVKYYLQYIDSESVDLIRIR